MSRSPYTPFEVDQADEAATGDSAVLVEAAAEQVAEPAPRCCTPQILCTLGLVLGTSVITAVGVALLILFVGYPGSSSLNASPTSNPTFAPT